MTAFLGSLSDNPPVLSPWIMKLDIVEKSLKLPCLLFYPTLFSLFFHLPSSLYPQLKVFQLKVDGVAFRFIPDSSQIINALKEKDKVGDSAGSFSGVPVFQSRSLTLRSQDNRYRPLFFRKEDLDKSLERASREQKSLNPAFKKGDVQVCILEDIVRGMKGEDSANSKWDDVVFIPPGFDVSVNRDSQESKQHLLTQLRRT